MRSNMLCLPMDPIMLCVTEATEEKGESSQSAEVRAIHLGLRTAEREQWPVLSLCTDSQMVANALRRWLQQWKRARSKLTWAAALWQNIATGAENIAVKVCHTDAHRHNCRATEEHQKIKHVDQAARTEVAQVVIGIFTGCSKFKMKPF
ncbi:hypothetical protein GRJ2_001125900 [Grus japonensis]|uniref:RNase H type-1 domain-containing protein n=1 Tax=Grus japonensis TaxID=30415 RepID=A0ABC9WN21_GRUJA